MSQYALDASGRPVSEDGNWVWDGENWVANPDGPAAREEAERAAARKAAQEAEAARAAEVAREMEAAPRYGKVAMFDLASKDSKLASFSGNGISPGRLASTTAGVGFAIAGGLLAATSLATYLAMRAVNKAMEKAMNGTGSFGDVGPGLGDGLVTKMIVFAFIFAILGSFTVLHAARIPLAILGAAVIVLGSFGVFYVLAKAGLDPEALSGMLAFPLVPALFTAGYVKAVTR